MRLLIDLQACQSGSRHRGIGRYSLSLTKALARNAGQDQVLILLNGLFPETIDPLIRELNGIIDPACIITMRLPGPVAELKPENAWRRHASTLLREKLIAEVAPDVLLIASMVEGDCDDTVTSVGWLNSQTLVAAVLYDLIPLINPDRHLESDLARTWYLDKVDSLRRCDLLLAISSSSMLEAELHLGARASRVVNISTAADDMFVRAQVDETAALEFRAQLGIARPYLMHSGNVEPRKNFDGLIRAYGLVAPVLRRRYQLVLVGRLTAKGRRQLEAVALEAGLELTEMVLAGHVSDEELVFLYSGCHLFVYPSLHEGFGLPALEAMHFGVPTIGSNTTSIPEVIGRSDATFDPSSEKAISQLIQRALTDVPFRESLAQHAKEQSARFSWDATARNALAAFRSRLATASRRALPSPRARMQLVEHQLASAQGATAPSDAELLVATGCLVQNEVTVIRLRAQACLSGALKWSVEHSLQQDCAPSAFNREFANALQALGHEVTRQPAQQTRENITSESSLAGNLGSTSQQDAGPFPAQPVHRLTGAYVTRQKFKDLKSSALLPQRNHPDDEWPTTLIVADSSTKVIGLICPTTHVARALLNSGVRVPVRTVGIGVDHWDRLEPSPARSWPTDQFRFLHVSSDLARAGTDALLAAFGDAFATSDEVALLIKTAPQSSTEIQAHVAAYRASARGLPKVHLIEDDLSDGELKALYLHCHVLVAPSRSETFGLPLAAALLCGIPVITTAWGGQADFCNAQNSWLIDYSFVNAGSLRSDEGLVWAEPDRKSLTTALRRARATSPDDRLERAQHGRRVLLENYLWLDVAAHAVTAVRDWHVRRPQRPVRLGWITTWNTRCGIASYARHIIEATKQPVQVLAPRQADLLSDDELYVHRCWLPDKLDHRLDDLSATIDELGLQVLVLQFNYGFFGLPTLARFLERQINAGRVLLVTMHSTQDPAALAANDENWQLATIAKALSQCHRVLVHTVADMNRLKDLGLADNLALFPHPLWHLPATSVQPEPATFKTPLVATFGYCLPQKGLLEVLQATAILHQGKKPVRLLMLNAEFPSQLSRELVLELRSQIRELALESHVDLRTDFLSDAEISALLGQADLLVFAYQDTQESASGAIRHGLASKRPVLVTPLPIFDELGDAVFRSHGLGAQALADAIEGVLDACVSESTKAQLVRAAADGWRGEHAVDDFAHRLYALGRSLNGLEPESLVHRFLGSSRAFQSEVGLPVGPELHTTGRKGLLLSGPALAVASGHYALRLHWHATGPATSIANLRVTCRNVPQPLVDEQLSLDSHSGSVVELLFRLDQAVDDLTIFLQVDAAVEAQVKGLELLRNSTLSH